MPKAILKLLMLIIKRLSPQSFALLVFWVLLAFAIQFDLETHQMDVQTAFLNGDLNE